MEHWVDRMTDEDGPAKAREVAEAAETPDAFLTALGKTLQEKEGVDTGLAGILATHVLTAKPAKDAVTQAREAIVRLASERAAPPKTVAENG